MTTENMQPQNQEPPAEENSLESQVENLQKELESLNKQLNDPVYLETKLRQMQSPTAPVPQQGQTPENDLPKPPEPPKFEPLNPEEMEPNQLVQEMEKRQQAQLEYMEKKLRWEKEVEEKKRFHEESRRKFEEEVEKIRKFSKEHPDLQKYADAVKEYYSKGVPLEDAYEIVKLKEAAKKAKEEVGKKPPVRAPLRSSQLDGRDKAQQIKSLDDAIQAAFDEVEQEMDVSDESED